MAVAAALLGCASPAPPPVPLLWRAEASDPALGGLFLLGSVHVGTPELGDLGPVVAEALRLSDELVVEIDVSRVEPSELAALGRRYGWLPQATSLRDVVSESTHRLLREYLEERGLEPDAMERMEPWLVAMLVLQLELEAAGYTPELGVDRVLIGRAAPELPVVALETLEEQFETLDRLPMPVQELMLVDTLARGGELHGDTGELMAAWSSGDEVLLADLLFAPLREAPELEPYYEAVFFRRNRTMAERLVALAADGRRRLVVVGAGHLVGERGLPGELARRGYRVERVADRPPAGP